MMQPERRTKCACQVRTIAARISVQVTRRFGLLGWDSTPEPGAQAQESATNGGQYRNPAQHGVGLVGVNQLDLTRRTGAFVAVNHTGMHGDGILLNTIRWNDNGPVQFFRQVMISDNLAQADIIIQCDDQFACIPKRCVFVPDG